MGNVQSSSRRSVPITGRTATSSKTTCVDYRSRRKKVKPDSQFRRNKTRTTCSKTTDRRKTRRISSTPRQKRITHAEAFTGEIYYANIRQPKREECWETFDVFRMYKMPLHSVLFLSPDSGLIVHLLVTHVTKCPRVGLFFQGLKLRDIQDKGNIIFVDETSLVRVPSTTAFGLFEIVEKVMRKFGEYDLESNSSKVRK